MSASGEFRRAVKAALAIASAAIFFWLTDVGLNAARARATWKNFDEVVAGAVFRSGQLRPEHLESAIAKHGVKTVVCLNPGESREEAAICSRRGVAHLTFDMPGSGRGRAEDFAKVLAILADTNRQPVLVHCSAGAYRTGVSVALYRMIVEGWRLDDTFEEMRYYGCAIHRDPELRDFVRELAEQIDAPRVAARRESPTSTY